jgi:hypothetical protein
MRLHHVITVTLALMSLARTGLCTERALVTSEGPNGYGYKFEDDLVAGSGLTSNDPRLRVVRHAARDLLIRPRTGFIPELLKTVENL